MKRGIDILGSVAGLVVTAPFFPLIALAIKFSSRGPVLYKWRVIGENGQPFVGYKFRTMVVNADELRRKLSVYNERKGPAFKMRNDPRITFIGRFLRRFSIDELPQLWSILKGDMSFVGPRPLQVYEWEQCTEYQKQRVKLKPGAISLWHVEGQPPTFSEWIELDLKYIYNWSLSLDMRILFQSVSYIVGAKNQ